MKVWGISDKGNVRKENQDSHREEVFIFGSGKAGTEAECMLCVVCDGMGGAKSGNVASAIAVETFFGFVIGELQAAERLPTQDIVQILLERAITAANAAIIRRAARDPDCADMGTTLVAAFVGTDGSAVIANVGDSRCYRITRGQQEESDSIVQVTKDHSLVEDMIDRGELKREHARSHPNRNLITRALSSDVNSAPDFFELKLNSGDFLLLCSDGLSNEVDPREMAFELLHYSDSTSAAERCLKIALERGAPDNVTVVVVEN